ncbi:hypothetical protein [Alteraurantiacibacter buctensis]|uniref:Porin n=1 Tax=Alteraurantiacibacter buctensis TaxID=1503981 RepID=A0A844YV63_9SPHN|nr:hypothetical protein [Alteraurantiacibacter buctensis]MXO70374.1 hypothetical protein [Alteraurantiacibacter buctensis]
MSRTATTGRKGRIVAALCGAALVVGVPSAGLAVSLIRDSGSPSTFVSFTPASADPEMARLIEARGSTVRLKRFTPAGAASGSGHAITVAVRVNPEPANAITVRNAVASAAAEASATGAPRIAATRYNLGMARGYHSFAQPAASRAASQVSAPIMSDFDLARSAESDERSSRFAARIALEQEDRPAPAAPRSLDSVGDQRLDVAGSYRLSRNLDVTAGVRYEQDRNRLTALPNVEQQDSQAVYVGTQFRF